MIDIGASRGPERPRLLRCFGVLALAAASAGCTDRDVTVQLRSLAKSGDVSYVCRNARDNTGVPLSECHPNSLADRTRDLIALVTQTSTGEIALVNVPLEPRDPASDEGVIDVDPSTPGYGFLRVGERPEDVISAPGGQASFVAAGSFGKPGLFALPTTCLGPPTPEQTIRDLTTWAACALPSPPGQMELVLQKGSDDGCEMPQPSPASVEKPSESQKHECSSSLLEPDPGGRWKLLVTLPEEGSVVVVDAQWLLDQTPGTFPSCAIQKTYPLSVDLPSTPVQQSLPDDLMVCTTTAPPSRPAPPTYAPHPSDIALADGVLYLSDDQAPVIHRLDVSRPCDAREMPPLLPMSVDDPEEVITTSKLAVSPLTPSGKRFVYAVDRQDLPMSSLMVFDVSPDSNDRTPLVRRGSTDIPGETPDRLRFSGAIHDVSFVLRDRPQVDPTTGVALVGVACNPHPGGGPGAEYQPRVNTTDDDDPAELRGVFGMVLLSNGQVSVVDVEDFDAPCRRPERVNPSGQMDFRGCANDPDLGIDPVTEEPLGYSDASGVTVTNEVSCRMVEPHRQRSADYGITNDTFGIRAPALSSFPQLQLPDTELARSLEERPKLLAVDFPRLPAREQPAQVYVGTTLFSRRTDPMNPPKSELVIDPARAQQHSIALPLVEPRAYTAEGVSLEYEGVVVGGLTSGIFAIDEEAGPEPKRLKITDPTGSFCERGVNDVELMRELGARKFALSGADLETFATTHADSLWITDDFPDEDDVWWSQSDRTLADDAEGSGCTCTQTRAQCQATFGEFDADKLNTTRQFGIEDARSDRLLLSGASACDTKCCFPSGTRYEIRSTKHWVLSGSSSGVRHDVVASREVITLPSGRAQNCIRDCSPKKRWDDPRVFEIACPAGSTPDRACEVGIKQDGDACVLQSLGAAGFSRPTGVIEDEAAWRCIHSTPTARFAVYRGLSSSVRGMRFTWSVSGTFKPLGFDLGGLSTAVAPASLSVLPDLDWLTIVDSGSLGLVVVDMDDQLRVLTPTSN